LEKKIAQAISILFHPLWMPFYMSLMLFFINKNSIAITPITVGGISVWAYVGVIIFVNTLLLPVLLILMMKHLKIIQSLSLERKEERIYPFFITSVFYVTTWYIFDSIRVFPFLSLIFVIAISLAIVAAVISFFWKISIHAMSMGAVTAAVLYFTAWHYILIPWPAYGVVFLSGLVVFSRLKLQAHSSSQVYAGFLLGVLLVGFVLYQI